MATDDERREAAERLGEIDAERLDRERDGRDGALLALAFVAEAIGLHYAPYEFTSVEVRDRLIDLIDPDSGQNADIVRNGRERVRDGGACDRDALLALSDELEGARREYLRRPVLLHGAPVLLREAAERVREACGEVE